jgi:hypothetical protein
MEVSEVRMFGPILSTTSLVWLFFLVVEGVVVANEGRRGIL